jgi:deoxyribonuclease-4
VNDYEGVFTEFERVVGLEYLKGIHLNDTKKPLASRVDRHESIGLGLLGMDFFKRFMQDPRFDNMPIEQALKLIKKKIIG